MHQTSHAMVTSKTYGMTPTHTKQLLLTNGNDRYIHGICQHQPGLHALLAFRASQTLFAAALLYFLRISSVSATERQTERGWGRANFHSQVLSSYTRLSLCVHMHSCIFSGHVSTKSNLGRMLVPTLMHGVLVWNSGGGVSIKSEIKEWDPSKNVLSPHDDL
jgi:hypothetical protein